MKHPSPLYDRPEVTRTYFFPQPGGPLPRRPGAGPVRLTLPGGERIGAYWSRPLRGAPVLLLCHGNGETIHDQLSRWPRWARTAGANLFLLDYPGYATSEGEPTFTTCRQAARAALRHLLARPSREVPVVVPVGRSAGSLFALDLAATSRSPRVRGLVLESAVADPSQRLADRFDLIATGLPRETILEQMSRDFDHRDKLARGRVPVLVLHTRGDQVVPAWNAERLAAWAGDRLYRLVLFDRGDHNTIQTENEAAYRGHLADFLRRIR
jgi:pimeloyl-ACP methyl ester carboxylesterase